MEPMQPIRLIALDLDGTLLNQNFELTADVCKSVRRARESGVMVVVATGRDLSSTNSFLQELGIEQIVVTSGGALVWINGLIVVQKSLTIEQTRKIIELGQQYDTGFFVDQPAITWKFGNPQFIKMYEHVSSAIPLDEIDAVFDTLPIKISLIQERASLLQLQQQLHLAQPDLHTTFPFEHVLDINQLGANKGAALIWLADKLGLSMNNVAAIGDSENDVSMLNVAGVSFAMGNAPAHVQETADHILPGNDRDGVAHAITMLLDHGHP